MRAGPRVEQRQDLPRGQLGGVPAQLPSHRLEALLQPAPQRLVVQKLQDGRRQVLRRRLVLQELGNHELAREDVGQPEIRLVGARAS